MLDGLFVDRPAGTTPRAPARPWTGTSDTAVITLTIADADGLTSTTSLTVTVLPRSRKGR